MNYVYTLLYVTSFLLDVNIFGFFVCCRLYLIDKIMRCEYDFKGSNWRYISREAVDFVSSLIKLDPRERLTSKQALEHKWLSKEFPLSDRRPSEGN